MVPIVDGEGPQVHVPGREFTIVHQRGTRRDPHDALGDPTAGIRLNLLRQCRQLGVSGLVTHHEAVAARAVDGLEHHPVESVENELALLGILQVVGVDVGQDRPFAEVVLDECRDVGVDGLVVGHAVADRVRDGHPAGTRGVQQARDTEHGIGPEMHWVEVVVIDAAVEHMHRFGTADRAHPDLVVAAVEVTALDELDAHPAGEERVLEVRRVVHAGGEHRDLRIRHTSGCRRKQRVEQAFRVFGHGLHALVTEQFGQHVGERAAVLQHVRDAGRTAQVVLEDREDTLLVADQVDACDVDAHTVGGLDAPGLPVEVAGTGHESARHDPVVQDPSRPVHVRQEHLQGLDALGDPLLDHAPFGGAEQPRHEVQRQWTLLAGQAERDALAVEVRVDQPPAFRQTLLAEPGQDGLQRFDGIDVREVAVHLLIGRQYGVDIGHGAILPLLLIITEGRTASLTARKQDRRRSPDDPDLRRPPHPAGGCGTPRRPSPVRRGRHGSRQPPTGCPGP